MVLDNTDKVGFKPPQNCLCSNSTKSKAIFDRTESSGLYSLFSIIRATFLSYLSIVKSSNSSINLILSLLDRLSRYSKN